MIKVSIIIPVYNAQKYLHRCLNSVINQTLKEIEVICVNDCSNDNSLEILSKYANKDKRINIINCTKNGGESVARNIGLDNSNGEYLAFVDNDDEIDLNFCEKLYLKAKVENADISKGEVHIIGYDGKETYSHLNSDIRKNNSKLYFAYYWWTGIYSSNLIKQNNIRFLEGYPLGGDVLFLNQAVLKSNKLALVDDVFYHYYRRENSGDSLILPKEKIISALTIHEKIIDNIKATNIDDKNGVGFLNFWNLKAALDYAFRNKKIDILKMCLDRAFVFYEKTKYNLKPEAESFYPIILDMLEKGKREELFEFYLKNDSSIKMLMANLRFLHNRKKEMYEVR